MDGGFQDDGWRVGGGVSQLPQPTRNRPCQSALQQHCCSKPCSAGIGTCHFSGFVLGSLHIWAHIVVMLRGSCCWNVGFDVMEQCWRHARWPEHIPYPINEENLEMRGERERYWGGGGASIGREGGSRIRERCLEEEGDVLSTVGSSSMALL